MVSLLPVRSSLAFFWTCQSSLEEAGTVVCTAARHTNRILILYCYHGIQQCRLQGYLLVFDQHTLFKRLLVLLLKLK